MSPDTLQWLGCISGVVGSLLLALHNRHSGWGFVFFKTYYICTFNELMGTLSRAKVKTVAGDCYKPLPWVIWQTL